MNPDSPDPSKPGEIVTFSATLVRSDTQAPISGKYLHVQGTDDAAMTWWEAGYYVTDANGATVGGVAFTHPGENQGIRATFDGDGTYAASTSNVEPHATRESSPPPNPPPPAPGTIATFVVLEPESPDPSAPGEMVALSGVLHRADTGAPLPDKFIHMEGRDYEGQPWWHAGYYWTDANGRAVGGTRFLFAHETQLIRATFEGDAQFSPSVSSLEPHATRGPATVVGSSGLPMPQTPPDTTIWAILALVTPSIALRFVRRRRDR